MKKRINLIVCLCISQLLFSQGLNVASSGEVYISPESYIYVANNNNLSVASTGKMTVDSNATDSGVLIVDGTTTGNIEYKRHIKDANWHFVSAPVETQSIQSFVTATNNGVATNGVKYGVSYYKNDEPSTSRWQHYTTANIGSSGNFINGKGYSNKRTAAGDYTFAGEMADTDVSVTIPYHAITGGTASTGTGSGQEGSHLWSLIGNPYPSFILANGSNSLLSENQSKLDPNFAYINVWDASSGQYKVINNASTAYYIAPGQGFMVDPKGNNQTFTFSKSKQKVQQTSDATFYRTSGTPKVEVHLSNGNEVRKTTLKYFSNTTRGLDVGWDAGTYVNGTPSLAIDTHLVSDSEGINFTLQCLPTTNYEESVVPLSIKAGVSEVINFSVSTENLPPDMEVFLEDKASNTFTNLSKEDYEITLTESLNGIGRFYLHTATEKPLSIEDNTEIRRTLQLYKTDNTNLRITGLQPTGKAKLSFYNIAGQELLRTTFSIAMVNDIKLPLNLSKGVYIAKFTKNGVSETKKIVIE